MERSVERVLVPPHTPKPLPSRLRFELTSALLSNSAIPDIQSTLYHTSQGTGWIDAVRERAKQLISSEQATSSHEVIAILVKEARENSNNQLNIQGGLARRQTHGSGSQAVRGPASQNISVRFPEEAVNKGKKVVRNALEDLVDVGTS
ncbi:MAG: hypothetical protein Q9209_003497 [Squamulea sp. 1 TL-2023]